MRVKLFVLTVVGYAAATSVYAQVQVTPVKHDPDTPTISQQRPDSARNTALTRDQVRQELERAQKNGEIAAMKAMYRGH
jgi:hypothetical protein